MESVRVTYVGEKRCSIDTLVRPFEYFVLLWSTYICLWQDFQLPSISTLTKVTCKVKTINDLAYMNNIFSSVLNERQKCCILDQVYVRACLQFHGGIVFRIVVSNLKLQILYWVFKFFNCQEDQNIYIECYQ